MSIDYDDFDDQDEIDEEYEMRSRLKKTSAEKKRQLRSAIELREMAKELSLSYEELRELRI